MACALTSAIELTPWGRPLLQPSRSLRDLTRLRVLIGRADPGRSSSFSALRRRAGRLAHGLGQIFYGLTGFEFEREAARYRADLENLFMFVLVGDLIGAPIMPPYYSLRLLPYLTGDVAVWKRRVLRERLPFEGEEYDLHGV